MKPTHRYKVITAGCQPDRSGRPLFTFEGIDESDLDAVINQQLEEGWELVQLALPTAYAFDSHDHGRAPLTIVLRKLNEAGVAASPQAPASK